MARTIWRGGQQALSPLAMARIAFLGLGVMGALMARHLAAAGHDSIVHNRSPDKARRLGRGAWRRAAASAGGGGRGAEAVIACVGADRRRGEVTIGAEGAFARWRQARSSSTIPRCPHGSRAAARGGGRGARPAGRRRAGFGRPGRRREGRSWRSCAAGQRGASRGAAADARPTARASSIVGPAGHGQLTKMVNQICIAGVVQGLVRGDPFRARRPGSTRTRCSRRSRAAPRRAGRWSTAGRRWTRRVRLRLRGRLDAQGSRPGARGGAGATARGCRSPRWSTSSMPTCRRWAADGRILHP